jgi:hypothetical protein
MKTVTFIKDGVLDMFGGLKVAKGNRMQVSDDKVYPLWEAGFIALDKPPVKPVEEPAPNASLNLLSDEEE